jgi:predicted 2-oxoglutarate/Fe(II)-dependent dioxygenase YbiX
VEHYSFKLQKNDGAVLSVCSAAFSNMTAVWSEVAELAEREDLTGGRIVVTNQLGEVLILVGAATARSYAKSKSQSLFARSAA